MNRGQTQIITIGWITITAAATWLGGYILNSPQKSAAAIDSVKEIQIKDGNRITAVETEITAIKSSQLRTEIDIKEILKKLE